MGLVEDSVAETMKEHASVVDSSLTECKHELENCDGHESSTNKENEDGNGGADGERMHPSCNMAGSSLMTNDKPYTRYFVIKSLSHQNIQLSVEKGIWATQVMNEPVLEEAFHNSDRVILIFSVNMSGFFQGYAQMLSSVSWKRDNVWSKSGGGSNPWGRSFKVKWLRLCDLPFQKTLHLKNPLNDYKPVKISRDCQELSSGIGEALCWLFDAEVDSNGKLKRTSSFVDDGLRKRHCRTSPVHFKDEDSTLPELSSHMRWDGSTMLHPSLLYQHVHFDPFVSCMASGPLVGGVGNGNDGSGEKHRWAEASKVYTRKSFNKGSKSSSILNPQHPSTSSNQAQSGAAAGGGGDTSLHQQIPPPPPPVNASDDDSSSLNRRPNPYMSKSNPSNGHRRVVTINLSSRSRHEVRGLRSKLTAELDQVRALYRKFDSRENHQAAAFGTTIATHSQFSASDAALTTPVAAKRGPPPAGRNSEAGSNAPLRRQLSVSVPDNSVGEKEKRTPKANQYYRNSDFVLGKEKFPPADSHSHKKSKSNGSKTAMVDNRLYGQAFKSCASQLSKLMKHKHGWVFNTPVDVKALGLHDYHIVIKHPMDLGTVKSRLSNNWYKTPEEFAEDVRLTFRNAMTYNPKGQDVHAMAEQLLQIFDQQWPAIEAEYTYFSSPRPPPVSAKMPPPIDMRRVLERSDSTVQPMSVDSKTKPVSHMPHVGRPPAPKKPKAKDPHKRDMTFEEKQKLSNNLQNLPPEKLDNVVQIIKRRNSSLSQHDDEIEVDIDSVDTETLWELDRFVTNYKKSLSKNKKKAELAELVLHSRSDNHHSAEQERVYETSSDHVVAEVPKESKPETVVDENDVAPPPPRGVETKADNTSRLSSSSSSSSESGSSSSDSDSDSSSAGSDVGQSPRT